MSAEPTIRMTAGGAPVDTDWIPDTFATVLGGLVPLFMMRLARPSEMARAIEAAADLADVLGGSGDRLTAPGNFKSPSDHVLRGDALNAAAMTLALGAYQPGGVTWCGMHWDANPAQDDTAARVTTVPTGDLL